MNYTSAHADRLVSELKAVSSEQKARAAQRYFPKPVKLIGATASDVKNIIKMFHEATPSATPQNVLKITETLLEQAQYSEEKLVAFGLLNKYAKRHFDEHFLERAKFWLEHYADNWALVDDLCIKTLYQFFLGHPDLIETIQPWSQSPASWCRRASNVAWVKFIHRPIGKRIYRLNRERIFENCDTLLHDSDPYVQKSIGWLLKVSTREHEAQVLAYLRDIGSQMPRSTVRYALEKVDATTRRQLLLELHEGR